MTGVSKFGNGSLKSFLQVVLMIVSIGGVVFTIGFNYANTVKKPDLDRVEVKIMETGNEIIRLRVDYKGLEGRADAHDKDFSEIKQTLQRVEDRQLETFRMVSALQGKSTRFSPTSKSED